MFIYDELVYRPILNLLIFTYNVSPWKDLGVVIIFLTFLTRLIVFKPTSQSIKTQLVMKRIQPELNKIKEKHKDDPTAQFKAQQQLQKEHGVSMWSSCLPLLIQLPFLIALYKVFQTTLTGDITGLYSFVMKPEHINKMFLNVFDLTSKGYLLPVLSGICQFWQARMMAKAIPDTDPDPMTQSMNTATQFSLPLVSLFIGHYLPSGLLLYWIFTSLFMIAQQYFVIHKFKRH